MSERLSTLFQKFGHVFLPHVGRIQTVTGNCFPIGADEKLTRTRDLIHLCVGGSSDGTDDPCDLMRLAVMFVSLVFIISAFILPWSLPSCSA